MYGNQERFPRIGLIFGLITFSISLSILITSDDSAHSFVDKASFYDKIHLINQNHNIDENYTNPHDPDIPPSDPKNHTKPEDPDDHSSDSEDSEDHPDKPHDPKNETNPDPDHKNPFEPKEIIRITPKENKPHNYLDLENRLFVSFKQNLVTLYKTSSFGANDGVVYETDNRLNFLCRSKHSKFCFSRYLADSIELIYAVCPIYSVDQWSRSLYYEFHSYFLGYIRSIGVSGVTIEGIYPGQKFIATKENNFPWDIQVHINEKVYLRENLLNVAAKKIKEWQYLAWIDAHQIFLDTYWFEDAIWAAEHHDGVQMFQYLEHLDERGNQSIPWFNLGSTQYAFMVADPPYKWPDMAKGVWNGNAFIIRRELYDQIGYILDTCIAGCCDCAYNIACFQHWYDWYLQSFPKYRVQLYPWIENAWKYFKKKPKALRGRMYHFYHPILFDWGSYLDKVSKLDYSLQDEIYRDDDFILHIKDGSRLAAMFPR